MVQHVRAVRLGSWTAESDQSRFVLTFENLYDWLQVQHKRGEEFYVNGRVSRLRQRAGGA